MICLWGLGVPFFNFFPSVFCCELQFLDWLFVGWRPLLTPVGGGCADLFSSKRSYLFCQSGRWGCGGGVVAVTFFPLRRVS